MPCYFEARYPPNPARIITPSASSQMPTYFVSINCPQKAQYTRRTIKEDSQNFFVSINSLVERCLAPGTPKGASQTNANKINPVIIFLSTRPNGGWLVLSFLNQKKGILKTPITDTKHIKYIGFSPTAQNEMIPW